MDIADLTKQPRSIVNQAAELLVQGFDEPRGWPTIALASNEVALVLSEGFGRAMVDRDALLGWIGGLPEYGGRVWELHPMVVRRGGLTATLGTDADSGMTSLSDADLYADVSRRIIDIFMSKRL